jgi:hypothetical protein
MRTARWRAIAHAATRLDRDLAPRLQQLQPAEIPVIGEVRLDGDRLSYDPLSPPPQVARAVVALLVAQRNAPGEALCRHFAVAGSSHGSGLSILLCGSAERRSGLPSLRRLLVPPGS